MPECVCRGVNPVCLECGGCGWIVGNYIPEIKAGKHTSKRKFKGAKYLCPYCQISFSDLIHHVSVAHDLKWEEFTALANIKALLLAKKNTRCCFCKQFVRDLDKHINKVHNGV